MDLSKLKITYFHSTEIAIDTILWGLLELGLHVTNPSFRVPLQEYTESDIEGIEKSLSLTDCVITQNFSASVARVCWEKKIAYISWVYDAPQRALYMPEALYETNFIFSFDRMQVERLKKVGVSNIFYCPLAANMTKAAMVELKASDRQKYEGQISFVGSLYKRGNIDYFLNNAPADIREQLDHHLAKFALSWNGESVFGKLPENLYAYIDKQANHDGFEQSSMTPQFIYESALIVPLLAQRERTQMCEVMSSLFDMHLYTNHPEQVTVGTKLKVHGAVDRNTDAYKVFASSKINLNLTMRGIETGVPQRVFDIMSIGGFVLSNYQKEAEILFKPDKEIVLCHSKEEMTEKAAYYLSHERERQQIAAAGYMRVKEQYNLPAVLYYILCKVFQ